jgi:carboxypeptidase Q
MLSRISRRVLPGLAAAALLGPAAAQAQTFPTDDPVIRRMWEVGMEQSQTEQLAHHLLDVIGPRLPGGPELAAAQDWLLETYSSWGVSARREQYGTWRGWRQGYLHADLLSPRLQTLEAELLAWSPGTNGPVEGEVVLLPSDATQSEAQAWIASAAGKFVMLSAPEPTCRAAQELEDRARPVTVERLNDLRRELRREFSRSFTQLGGRGAIAALEEAGILGSVTSRWSGGWGVNKVFNAPGNGLAIDVSCEDFSMLYRLAQSGNTPRIRVDATAEFFGTEVPQFNVIAELRGTELPNEYVILSAHLDSWHAGTGATDNGTGSIMMLEAMRILKETYPNPRRTILVGHWGAEEMGLVGSQSFAEDHPDVMEGVQAVWNQDNGTWRIERIEGQGFAGSGERIRGWLAPVPTEITSHIELDFPGQQQNQGSDHTAFVCRGVPAFRFQSHYPEYRQYTWHTNRDTYDKIVFDDLKENATLAAMVAYMASEDPERMPRERVDLGVDSQGRPRQWSRCGGARRSWQ